MSYSGRIENGMIVFNEPVSLPDGTDVRVEPVNAPMGDFWHPLSLDELAEQQGVKPIESLDDLAGGWPESELNDGFEDAVVQWRRQECASHEGKNERDDPA
jgi:hypothetical protein